MYRLTSLFVSYSNIYNILKHGYAQEEKFEDISFKDFYKNVWLNDYISGHLSTRTSAPSLATIEATRDIFRLHIIPMFEDFTLHELNNNKSFVITKMKQKSVEYANFKTIRSYVNSIFE